MSGFTFILGIVECFFGYRMLKIILGVTGFIVGGWLCAGLLYEIVGRHPVMALIAGLVGGAIGSSLMIGLFFLGLFILGTALGLLVGGAMSACIFGSADPIIIVPLAIVGGIATIILSKSMIIISTSFTGAYLIVFSVGNFIGMPNIISLFRRTNGLREYGGQFFIMLLFCFLVGITGIFVQYKHKYTATSAGTG